MHIDDDILRDTCLCRQEPGEVNLRHHFAASFAFLLVSVLVVLDQVPNFDPALQVGGQHGHAGMRAVGAGGCGAEGDVHAWRVKFSVSLTVAILLTQDYHAIPFCNTGIS